MLPPDIEAEYDKLRWQCAVTVPAVRSDGCPGPEPISEQTACSTADQACSYGDCCITEYRCVGGAWRAGNSRCPP